MAELVERLLGRKWYVWSDGDKRFSHGGGYFPDDTPLEAAAALKAAAAEINKLVLSTGAHITKRAEYLADLTAARADIERLDWLENINLRTNARNGTVYGWRYDINHNRASLTDHNLPALTIREAIDSARFPEKASEIRNASLKEGARLKAFDERFPGVRARALLGEQADRKAP